MKKEAKKKLGRPVDIKAVKRAKELKGKGLSHREIMRVMKRKDVKTIHRWLNYDVG